MSKFKTGKDYVIINELMHCKCVETSYKQLYISELIEDLKSHAYPVCLNANINKDSSDTSSHVLDAWYELGRVFIRKTDEINNQPKGIINNRHETIQKHSEGDSSRTR